MLGFLVAVSACSFGSGLGGEPTPRWGDYRSMDELRDAMARAGRPCGPRDLDQFQPDEGVLSENCNDDASLWVCDTEARCQEQVAGLTKWYRETRVTFDFVVGPRWGVATWQPEVFSKALGGTIVRLGRR